MVQETCRPDFYPCDASAAVAYAGTFTDKAGSVKSVVMFGQRVIICTDADIQSGGKSMLDHAETCKEVDLGVVPVHPVIKA